MTCMSRSSGEELNAFAKACRNKQSKAWRVYMCSHMHCIARGNSTETCVRAYAHIHATHTCLARKVILERFTQA